jgi:hypothetical protein
VIIASIGILLLLDISCKKQEDSDKLIKNNDYPWSEGIYFNGSIGGNSFYISDSSLNSIGTFGKINFKWHNDSISRLYGIQFDFNNGFSMTLNFLVIGSRNDFDTISGCYKNFNKMIGKGRQLFLYDYRPIPKNGFYTLYFKKDLSKDTIDYLPKYQDFQDSIDYYLEISNVETQVDTSYSRVTQEILFEGNLSCKLIHFSIFSLDTIEIKNARFKAKFDQDYYLK